MGGATVADIVKTMDSPHDYSVDRVLAGRVRRAQAIARSVIRKRQARDFTYPWLAVRADVAAFLGGTLEQHDQSRATARVVLMSESTLVRSWQVQGFEVDRVFLSGQEREIAKKVRADISEHHLCRLREAELELASATRRYDEARARVAALRGGRS